MNKTNCLNSVDLEEEQLIIANRQMIFKIKLPLQLIVPGHMYPSIYFMIPICPSLLAQPTELPYILTWNPLSVYVLFAYGQIGKWLWSTINFLYAN